MSQNGLDGLVPFNKNLSHIVETHLERFTRKQTVIIEKWNKAEARNKEEMKGRDDWSHCNQEIDKQLNLVKNRKNQQYSLLDSNLAFLNSNQSQIIDTKIIISKFERLIEEGISCIEFWNKNEMEAANNKIATAQNILRNLQVCEIVY